jgi:hypothetical protein
LLLTGIIISCWDQINLLSRKTHLQRIEKEVVMKKVFIILILPLFLLVTARNIFCEEMAKEGTDSGHSISTGTLKVFPLEEGTLFVTWEQKGVYLNDSAEHPIHNISRRCAGTTLIVKNVGTVMGYCIGIAPKGDKIFLQVTQENRKPGPGPHKGKYKYIGGTGKFAGIEGGGEYTSYSVQPSEEGTYQNVGKSKGSYKLP